MIITVKDSNENIINSREVIDEDRPGNDEVCAEYPGQEQYLWSLDDGTTWAPTIYLGVVFKLVDEVPELYAITFDDGVNPTLELLPKI